MARVELNLLESALLMFKAHNGRYAVSLEELSATTSLNTRDPWGNDYVFIPNVSWAQLVSALQNKDAAQQQL